MHKVLLTVPEAADALSVSRATVYRLLAAGRLASVTIGCSRRIPYDSVRKFVRELELEAHPTAREVRR